MTYWAQLKTFINVNKINGTRSSVLFTKVDYCASAKKENELSQVTKSVDKELSMYGSSYAIIENTF